MRWAIEEQIGWGLNKDISHSAFSHCIDYVLDAGSGGKHATNTKRSF